MVGDRSITPLIVMWDFQYPQKYQLKLGHPLNARYQIVQKLHSKLLSVQIGTVLLEDDRIGIDFCEGGTVLVDDIMRSIRLLRYQIQSPSPKLGRGI